MEAELSELLGRKVDLNTPQFLSCYFREQVLAEAEVQIDFDILWQIVEKDLPPLVGQLEKILASM
jgi:hypothetical protein